MLKLSGSRDLQLICVVFAIVFAIGVESACDPHCNGVCIKFPNGGCDKICNGTWGLNVTSHTCGPCQPKCISACNKYGPGTCEIACMTGYCLQNYTCVAVPRCVSCTNGTVMPCTGCSTGYTLVNGECIQCDANCSVACTAPYTCPLDQCNDPGYGSILVPDGSGLYACAPCDVNCAGSCKVQRYGKCDATCKAGYALDTTTYTCKACGTNCAGGCATSGPGFCDCPCNTGYTCVATSGDPTKKACYPCADHCTSGCDTEGKGCCDSTCATGYTWTLPSTSTTCHICL